MDVKLLFLMNCAIVVYCQSTLSSSEKFEMFEDVKFEIDSIRQLLFNLQRGALTSESPVIQEMKSQIEDIRQVVLKLLNRQKKDCPFGFEYLPEAGRCYKVIFETLDWYNASVRCQQMMSGVHLAAITSADENDAIVKFLQRELLKEDKKQCTGGYSANANYAMWIGGQTKRPNQCGDTYVWRTPNGIEIPFNYTNWASTQPNCYGGNENCVQIVPSFNYSWNDTPCAWTFCAICEI